MILNKLFSIFKIFSNRRNIDTTKEIFCPVCGYYCLGKGGYGCIDKPKYYKDY